MSTVMKTRSWFKPIFDLDSVQEESKINANNTNETKMEPVKVHEQTKKFGKANHVPCKNWMRNFDPSTIEELVVNKKKIIEVENWILQMSGSCCSEMLLLSGPVGCAKTITVYLLAKKHKMRIAEWITPVDVDLLADNGQYEYREKQSIKFQNFIINAANFNSLLDKTESSKLVLVEDFPNTFLRTPSEFLNVLQHYRECAKSPIVFICSESHMDTKNIPLNLFTSNLKEQFNIHHIVFNAVSQTGLKAALNRVSDIIEKKFKESYNKPTPEQIECVINSSAGDVRSAVLNLHFACLKGTNVNLETSILRDKEIKIKKGTKRKKETSSKFTSLGKDQTVSILHGVGRVLNPKVVNSEGKDKLTHQPDAVVEQFISQPKSFVNFLAENYLPHFAAIEQAERAAAALSDADCLLNEWREKYCQEYGLYIAVAGLMVANTTPVSAWNPVRGPKPVSVQYPSPTEIPLLEANELYTGKVLVSDYQTYCKIIVNKKKTSNSHLLK